MRALLLLALLAAAAPARAQTLKGFERQFSKSRSDAGNKVLAALVEGTVSVMEAASKGGDGTLAGYILAAPLLPMAPSLSMEPRLMPERRVRARVMDVNDRVRAWGGELRYGWENHINVEAHWTAFLEEGAQYDLHYFGARVSGAMLAGDSGELEYGFGAAGLSGRLSRGGPEFSLAAELRPRSWAFVDARAAAAIMQGGTIGELSAGAGLRWRALELRGGYRALAGPFRVLGGPELGVGLRW